MLSYKVPFDPVRHRRRREKALGAIYLSNEVCLLPSSPVHLRQIRVLANEIGEMRGEACLSGGGRKAASRGGDARRGDDHLYRQRRGP